MFCLVLWCFYMLFPPLHCLYRNWTCPVPRISPVTRNLSPVIFQDLTFDDAELFPILAGRICHQNIYDLVQIWKSDEAMHRHESTTLETSNKNAWKWHWERRFCVFFWWNMKKSNSRLGFHDHCTMARLWRTEREYLFNASYISLFCKDEFSGTWTSARTWGCLHNN